MANKTENNSDLRNTKFEEYLKEMRGEISSEEADKEIEEQLGQDVTYRSVDLSYSNFEDNEDSHPEDEAEVDIVPGMVFNEPEEEEFFEEEEEKPKKTHRVRNVILSVIAVILIIAMGAGFFVYKKLNMIGTNGDSFTGSGDMKNDIDASDIDSITDAASLQALLKGWYSNGGDKMQSKYVRNILLLGVDSDSKLSDTMMLASINIRRKTISLVSFYRDSYTYMDDGKNQYYAKMNAAYRYGGAKFVVKTIENDYKIKIDDYAMVGYDTFPKMIDALGGVDVKVTKREADYLNETWWRWTRTKKKITFKAGNMHMDGEHALMFCRIRKLDSDIGRTERQRRVVLSVMDTVKDASLSELNNMINVILPNLKTSMTKTQLLNYAKDALQDDWVNFKISQSPVPTEEYCLPGYAGDQWIWICDYEGAAADLQEMLYGQTNIKLDPDRSSALDFAKGETSATTNASDYGSYNPSTTYYRQTTTAAPATGPRYSSTTARFDPFEDEGGEEVIEDTTRATTSPTTAQSTTRSTTRRIPVFD